MRKICSILLPLGLLFVGLMVGGPTLATPPSSSAGLQELANALNARERALERKERALADKETDLAAIEAVLIERLKELEALRQQMAEALTDLEEVEDDRVVSLVAMVEAMRPKDGAAMLGELEPDLAVRVLNGMMQAKAGKLLASMRPDQAGALAERMTNPLPELLQ